VQHRPVCGGELCRLRLGALDHLHTDLRRRRSVPQPHDRQRWHRQQHLPAPRRVHALQHPGLPDQLRDVRLGSVERLHGGLRRWHADPHAHGSHAGCQRWCGVPHQQHRHPRVQRAGVSRSLQLLRLVHLDALQPVLRRRLHDPHAHDLPVPSERRYSLPRCFRDSSLQRRPLPAGLRPVALRWMEPLLRVLRHRPDQAGAHDRHPRCLRWPALRHPRRLRPVHRALPAGLRGERLVRFLHLFRNLRRWQADPHSHRDHPRCQRRCWMSRLD
jgi:hypothetical protein